MTKLLKADTILLKDPMYEEHLFIMFTDRVTKSLVGVRQNTRIMSYILVSLH